MMLRYPVILLFLLCLLPRVQGQAVLVENKGQWPARVTHRAALPGTTIWCEGNSILIDRGDDAPLHAAHNGTAPKPDHLRRHALRLRFLGADSTGTTTAHGRLDGHYSYFLGNDPVRWAGGAMAYRELVHSGLYPGVDLHLRLHGDGLKYDLVLAPGTDPATVRFTYEGADHMALRGDQLVVGTRLGELLEEIPLAYQEHQGQRIPVHCQYRLKDGVVGFRLKGYDPALPLVIDPTLSFSSFSGSTANNFGYTATFDAAGFLYAGSSAFGQGYPTTLGAYDVSWNGGVGQGANAGTDIAISKFDTTGTFLVWSTFLGGAGDDLPHSLIVNDADELIVLGTTGSADHPTTPNAFDASFGGGTPFSPEGLGTAYPNGSDMVLARLSADGSQLLAATYVGGTGNDGINAAPGLKYNYADEIRGEVLLTPEGDVLVASCTRSTDFPVTPGAYRTTPAGGTHDAVVFRMDPALSTMVWSTYFGGTLADAAYSAELDGDGHVLIAGGTVSVDIPLPPGAVQPLSAGGAAEAFVARLSQDGSSLLHATYWGSSAYDQAYFVERDDAGSVYLLGQTMAPSGLLIANVEYAVPTGGQFITKLSSDLSTLLWSSRFGALSGNGVGRPNISPTAFLVDHCDKIYVSGWGSSIQGGTLTTNGLPVTPDAFQTTTDGQDLYLAVFDIDMQGSGPLYATYFGGPQSAEHVDGGTSRFDRRGRIYHAACAGCGGNDDFPIHPTNALSSTNNNSCNLGVFKFDFDAPLVIASPTAPDTLCAGTTVQFGNHTQSGATYLWDFGDGNSSTATAPQHGYAAPGQYQVSLTATDPTTCNHSDIATITVTVLAAPPVLTVSDDVVLCGPSADVVLVASTGGLPTQYLWSSSPDLTPPLNPAGDSTVTVPPVAGTYYVQATVVGACAANASVSVSASLTEATLTPDVAICTDQQATLAVGGVPAGSTIAWSPTGEILSGQGSTTITTTPGTTTQYTVVVSAPDGCIWTGTTTVVVSDMNASSVSAHANPTEVLTGEQVQLNALPASGVSYIWSPTAALNNPTISAPLAVVSTTTTFTVTVSDGTCTQAASVTVHVYELRCEDPDVFVPDAFTPNGDGNNDVLLVRGRHITDLEFRVFDRWGELVFHTTDQSHGWDGSYKGAPVDPAVFVYWLRADCIDGQRYEHKGNITVIR